jgi:AMP-polyphosphate phosphotransferase
VGRPLDDVDLTTTLSASASAAAIADAQKRLTKLTLTAAGLLGDSPLRPSTVVLFEGFDAAGKGGAIRRLTGALDPRHVRVVPIGPPNEVELAHHFLWRFQPPLPCRGGVTVFDRSWYGRLLVERVEGLISPDEVARSADEIVEFERALVADGAVIVKIWLSISPDEQLRRFEKRRDSPTKQWKLTNDDWRNRERRDDYVAAANDMIERTDHPHARWHVVSGEDKHAARVAVLDAVTTALEHALSGHGHDGSPSADRARSTD